MGGLLKWTILLIILLISMVLFFIFKANLKLKEKNKLWLLDTPIAHRGLHSIDNKISPENTLKSFKRAVDNGYAIELDVQSSKDNRLVIFHDQSLKRLVGVDKDIQDLKFNDLKELKVNGSEEIIPRLSQVLDIVSGKVPIYIEIKKNTLDEHASVLEKRVLEMMNAYKKKYPDAKFAIISFNHNSLSFFRNNSDFIIGHTNKFIDYKNVLHLFKTKPDFLILDALYNNNWFTKFLGLFFPILTYNEKLYIEGDKIINFSKHKYSNNIIFDLVHST